jgi:hypothetical protein
LRWRLWSMTNYRRDFQKSCLISSAMSIVCTIGRLHEALGIGMLGSMNQESFQTRLSVGLTIFVQCIAR